VKETETMVLFWDGIFSQWHLSPFFDQNGNFYLQSEQYMMAEKARLFNDKDTYNKIMKARSPGEQKKLGRVVGTGPGAEPFDIDRWNAVCRMVVWRGNLFKFTQNAELKQSLFNTGDKILVEASPYDLLYGVGLSEDDPRILDRTQWRGKNWLGEALMEVRKTIKDAVLSTEAFK